MGAQLKHLDNEIKDLKEGFDSIKQNIMDIQTTISEIDADIHREIRPEYLKKLQQIKKEKGRTFGTMKEFEASLA